MSTLHDYFTRLFYTIYYTIDHMSFMNISTSLFQERELCWRRQPLRGLPRVPDGAGEQDDGGAPHQRHLHHPGVRPLPREVPGGQLPVRQVHAQPGERECATVAVNKCRRPAQLMTVMTVMRALCTM